MKRAETEVVLCTVVEEVLEKTGITAQDIDILVVNCSLFNPTPSLSALVASKMNMRSDLLNYNLSGMGCSAGLISIDLAQRLLKQRPNSLALVLSTENMTGGIYQGNDKAFLIQNTLFRVGGAAVILSNKPSDIHCAKYKLKHVVRTMGTDKQSYEAVYATEDDEGFKGVRLSKDIVKVASKVMTKNLTTMG